MPLIPRDRIQSPRLLEIALYLDTKRRGGGEPSRAEIDPVTEIPKLAQHLLLIERAPSGRFRYRLIGSVPAEIHGRDMTGLWIDEVARDTPHTSWEPGLPALFETDALLCGSDRPSWKARTHIAFEWISQRLAVPQGAPDLVLLAIDYQWATTS